MRHFDRTPGPRELKAVRMNDPVLPFKQAVGSAHRAAFDIKVHSDKLRTG